MLTDNTAMDNEVQQYMKAYASWKCKLLSDIGGCKYIISAMHPKDGFTIKFQLMDTYPNDAPTLSLRSDNVDSEQLSEFGSGLAELAGSLVGKPMLVVLTERAECFFKTIAQTAPADVMTEKKVKPQNKERKKKAPAQCSDEKILKKGSKKSSLKTADDVIKRVQWDEAVDEEGVVIGYIDRFRGVVEKPFSHFSWEDISTIDYYTFAVPRHRIQYFKYHGEVVWDKTRWLDHVFGSDGSGVTILDVIQQQQQQQLESPKVGDTDQKLPPPADNAAAAWDGDNYIASYDDIPSDASSDDGITVLINPNTTFQRANSILYSDDDNDEEADDDDARNRPNAAAICGAQFTTPYWRDKCRPNFFVCIRVTDEAVRTAAARLQTLMCDREPRYEECCVPPNQLHLTLCTLRLDDAETVAACAQQLRDSRAELVNSLPRQSIRLHGVGCFHRRVLYAHADVQPEFHTFVDHLAAVLRAGGFRSMDHHDFVPHMSLLKVSRPVSRLMGSCHINPYVYHGMDDAAFGEQTISSIYLCSMEKERRADGFYLSPGCVEFVRELSLAN